MFNEPAEFAGLSRDLCERQRYLETRIARFRGDMDIPPVLLHYALYRVQTETRSFADSLGCEKWIKDVRFYFR